MKKGRVLVTGASGFIASHLIPLLRKVDYQVIECDKKLGQDLAELKSLAGIDFVVHLASYSNIKGAIDNLLESTYNDLYLGVKLLELAHRARIKKFIFPSSAVLYGDAPTPWTENLPVITKEPYSLQKAAMENYCRYYAQIGLPTVILRLFQVFGENQRSNTALGKWLQLRAAGQPLPVANSKRDFVYAADVAEAILSALTSAKVGQGEVINIASGQAYSMLEIAKMLGDRINMIPQKSFETSLQLGNIQKAKQLLNWAPKTDIKIWLKKYLNRHDHSSHYLPHVRIKKTAAVSGLKRSTTTKPQHRTKRLA